MPRVTKLVFFIVLATAAALPLQAMSIALQNGTADFSQNTTNFSAAASIDGSTGDSNGWAVDPQEGASHTAVFETVSDVGFASGADFTFTLDQFLSRGSHELGRFRISITTDDRSTFADGLQSGGDVTATWTVLDPTSFTSAGGATLTEQPDHSILASGTTPATDTYTVTASTALTGITGIRIEALTDASLPSSGPGRNPDNGNFVLTEFLVDAVASPVPEPSTIVLIAIAGAIVGSTQLIRRRQLL